MLPRVHLVKQVFPRPRVGDLEGAVRREIAKIDLARLPAGAKVGITGGSRGINRIVDIYRAVGDELKARGLQPVIVAAMGSHGGGTAEGQLEVLTSLGVTEKAVGAPVWTCADTVEVGKTAGGLTAYITRLVEKLDAILVVNRVKVHTALTGEIQSGLVKSCVVGLGGPAGAEQFHSLGVRELPECLRAIGTILIDRTPILGGLAIIENGYEETAHLIGVPARRFLEDEPGIFKMAAELMPSLPVQDLDVLVIEEMGKNFSGTGIDTNVVGRFRVFGEPEPARPSITRVVVLDLSEASHGNANGVGLADFVTDALVGKMDLKATYLNILTTGFVQRGFTPAHFPTERETVEMAVRSLGRRDPAALRLMVVPNTLHLEKVYASEALLPELRRRERLEIGPDAVPLEFDAAGRMRHRLASHGA